MWVIISQLGIIWKLERSSVYELKTLFYKSINSALGRNVLSLYALQFANYVLPLIAVPYLVRVLGPEKFGAVAFGQSLMMYFVLMVNYGFDWSATRTISVQRDNLYQVSRTASAVLGTKVLLTIISFAVLSFLIAWVPRFREMAALLYVLFGIVVGNAMFPQWLFQGLEQMLVISVINLTMRGLVTVGIFVLIHNPEDFIKYAALVGLQWVGAGVLGVIWASLQMRVKFSLPEWSHIIKALREGHTLFLSEGVVSLFTVGNAFILGLLTNSTVVGYYSAAEKLVKAIVGLTQPITFALYPRFSKLATVSREVTINWARKGLAVQGIIGAVLSTILLLGAPMVTRSALGSAYSGSIPVMQVLSFLPLIIGIGSGLGRFILLPMGYDHIRLGAFVVAGLVNVGLAVLLVPHWAQTGMAWAVLVSELWVTLSFWAFVQKKGLNPLSGARLDA
jgi:PST family polysaccharide transporter